MLVKEIKTLEELKRHFLDHPHWYMDYTPGTTHDDNGAALIACWELRVGPPGPRTVALIEHQLKLTQALKTREQAIAAQGSKP